MCCGVFGTERGLFDPVAALVLGVAANCHEVDAAIQLEAAAQGDLSVRSGGSPAATCYPFQVNLDPASLVRGIVGDVSAGVPVAAISARFHASVDAIRHLQVPPNDGGLALGQLAIVAARDAVATT